MKSVWIALSLVLSFSAVQAEQKPIPRTVIALFQSDETPDVRDTPAHQFAEMPLNHLGYRLEYHDLSKGLPEIAHRDDVAGVLSWLTRGAQIKDTPGYLKWAGDAVDRGKRFVILGSPGFYPDYPYDANVPLAMINAFWKRLGLFDEGDIFNNSFAGKVIANMPGLVDFERSYRGVTPPFRNMRAVSKDIQVFVAIEMAHDENAVLIASSPRGTYAAEDYEMLWDGSGNDAYRFWYINPFLFFRMAFGDFQFPKPDTTTLVGNRVYYGHIDGDGWISRSLISEYRQDKLLCADVIYRTVLEPASDLPCSVGPIAADMMDKWVGFPESREVARKIFALPHIEVAVHTLSHPFDWSFFANYTPAKELPFLTYYPFGGFEYTGLWSIVRKNWINIFGARAGGFTGYPHETELEEGYDVPRAYANFPFNVRHEVLGAIADIADLAPAGKKPMVYLWSGDCAPFEEAVKLTREAKIRNLNGGNSRFDTEYPSYGWIRPLGRQAGDEQQIYASAANENVYTNSWRQRFFNYNKLPQTYRNTDIPWRIKPINLYYHMFSGERLPSLQAVLSNVRYVRQQPIVPVATSHFAAIADGFYAAEVVPLAENSWAIEKRGELQTVRFDHCTLRSVDFAKSEGILGQRHLQGSLYVSLMPNSDRPVVTLKDTLDAAQEPIEEVTYLLESRWPIDHVQRGSDGQISFTTQGFGKGRMLWRVLRPGSYRVKVTKENESARHYTVEAVNHIIEFEVEPRSTFVPVHVAIERAL